MDKGINKIKMWIESLKNNLLVFECFRENVFRTKVICLNFDEKLVAYFYKPEKLYEIIDNISIIIRILICFFLQKCTFPNKFYIISTTCFHFEHLDG